jgi:hypothetical protein
MAPVIVDEGDEGTENNIARVQLTLSAPAEGDVTVTYELLDGTALNGVQFTPMAGQGTTGTVSFANGETTASVDVLLMGNSTANSDSKFSVKLLSATAGTTFANETADVTIWDDDHTITFEPVSVAQSVNEGDSGPTDVTYRVVLSGAADHDIVVSYESLVQAGYGFATSTGAAADFTGTSGTLTFKPNQPLEQTITAKVNGDVLPGPDESFSVGLTREASASGAYGFKLGADSTATTTIVNDDVEAEENKLTVSLVVDPAVTAAEGTNATFKVILSRLSESNVVINYHTVDGTASSVNSLDFAAKVNASQTIVSGVLHDRGGDPDGSIRRGGGEFPTGTGWRHRQWRSADAG